MASIYEGGLPFPPPADHILSELSTMTLPSWVALHIMAHSFELRQPLHHVKAVICEGSKKQQLEPCMEQLIQEQHLEQLVQDGERSMSGLSVLTLFV